MGGLLRPYGDGKIGAALTSAAPNIGAFSVGLVSSYIIAAATFNYLAGLASVVVRLEIVLN